MKKGTGPGNTKPPEGGSAEQISIEGAPSSGAASGGDGEGGEKTLTETAEALAAGELAAADAAALVAAGQGGTPGEQNAQPPADPKPPEGGSAEQISIEGAPSSGAASGGDGEGGEKTLTETAEALAAGELAAADAAALVAAGQGGTPGEQNAQPPADPKPPEGGSAEPPADDVVIEHSEADQLAIVVAAETALPGGIQQSAEFAISTDDDEDVFPLRGKIVNNSPFTLCEPESGIMLAPCSSTPVTALDGDSLRRLRDALLSIAAGYGIESKQLSFERA